MDEGNEQPRQLGSTKGEPAADERPRPEMPDRSSGPVRSRSLLSRLSAPLRGILRDDEADAEWETGTWDTGWAAGTAETTRATDTEAIGVQAQESLDYGRGGAAADGAANDFWQPGRQERRANDNDKVAAEEGDTLAQSLNALAQLAVIGAPIGRIARLRRLLRRRPASALLLAFFLLAFILTCCAPLLPVLRLGYDAADAVHRVSTLQSIFSGGTATLFNPSKLKEAQTQVDGITHDLYEINSAMNLVGAPLASASPSVKNYRLLVRIGYDLTTAADEGLGVAQTLLLPLQGGALASNATTPGITPNDITQARAVLYDASARIDDAIAAYQSLDQSALPSQLKPGSKYGQYLALLPTAKAVIGQMSTLLESIPALLGIGQPAYYLVVAMDRTELRPGGGFQGNYGILELDGGKQSKDHPLSLTDVYKLDHQYYENNLNGATCTPGQPNDYGPQPPEMYWWWPYRGGDASCQYTWGLRDSNLSPDFPTNARAAMQLADAANVVPNNAPLQGVIAFSPVLIEDLLQVTGSLTLPQYNVTVTPQNLEDQIHLHQLVLNAGTADRKEFTHDLSSALLDRLKGLHGNQLRPVLKIVEVALQQKDLQIYLNDPRAELILQQLGLASQISTGNGDGFFVVDANDGGNKANAFVNEYQTDYVTLLPNGGALHRLQIEITYDKKGSVYDGKDHSKNYQDVQRTYLPGDATILGYSGFNPSKSFYPGGCHLGAESFISACDAAHMLTHPVTTSDVPGRTMVMGAVTVWCGPGQTIYDYLNNGDGANTVEDNGCYTNPQPHTVDVYIEWYTPHAFTINSDGHGTYSELVEKQPGSSDFLEGVGDYLTVYVDASQLHARNPQVGDVTKNPADAFAGLMLSKKPLINNQKLLQNTLVTYNF